jgi:hypothetical protein
MGQYLLMDVKQTKKTILAVMFGFISMHVKLSYWFLVFWGFQSTFLTLIIRYLSRSDCIVLLQCELVGSHYVPPSGSRTIGSSVEFYVSRRLLQFPSVCHDFSLTHSLLLAISSCRADSLQFIGKVAFLLGCDELSMPDLPVTNNAAIYQRLGVSVA